MSTADFENQIASRLVAEYDPLGTRTIGSSTFAQWPFVTLIPVV